MKAIFGVLPFLTAIAASAGNQTTINCAAGEPCMVTCGANTTCADNIINATLATNLTLSCGEMSSCLKTTALCPSGASSSCIINCTDSFSCLNLTVSSSAANTELNCMTADLNTSNICSRAHLEVSNGNASINCMQNAANQEGNDLLVCNELVLNTNMNINMSSNMTSSIGTVSFRCLGNGANCRSIDIDATNARIFTAEISGRGSNLNDSFFISNAQQYNVWITDNAEASDNTFRGNDMAMSPASNDSMSSNVTVRLLAGSASIRNSYIFGGAFSVFQLIGDSLLYPVFSNNVLNITNPLNITQTLNVSDIAGDSSNTVTATNLTNFTFTCSTEELCGFGSFAVSINNAFRVSGPGIGMFDMMATQSNAVRATLDFDDATSTTAVSLRCLSASCENVTANLSCTAAMPCSNVSITARESYLTPVYVFCAADAQCNGIRVDNKMGATMVNISNGSMSNANIAGDPIYITGKGSKGVFQSSTVAGLVVSDVTTVSGSNGFVFTKNTFELNNNASIVTDNTTMFTQNVIRSTDTSAIAVSVVDTAMNFNKTNNREYNFNTASYVILSMAEGMLFQNGMINVFQSNSTLIFDNQQGRIFGTTFNCNQCTKFAFITNGTQTNTSSMEYTVDPANTVNIRNASNAFFLADNGGLLMSETIVINAGNASNVTFMAYSGGVIQDVSIHGIGVTITNLDNAVPQNVSLQLGQMYIGVEASVAALEFNRSLTNFTIDAEPADDLTLDLGSNLFADNIIRANEVVVKGDGAARFVNNALVSSRSTRNCTLSINNNDNHNMSQPLRFAQTSESLAFMEGDYVNLTLLNATFMNAVLEAQTIGHFLIYSGNASLFADNELRVNRTGMLQIMGANGTAVANTTVVDRDSNAMLSFGYMAMMMMDAAGNQSNVTTTMMNMTKMNHEYMFDTISYLNVSVMPERKFINNMITVSSSKANVSVLNNGTYFNNTISAAQLASLNVHCYGQCYNDKVPTLNSFLVSNITQNLMVDVQAGDVVNKDNMLFNFDHVANVMLSAQHGGIMGQIRFANTSVSNSIMVLNDNATMNDMEVNASPNTQMFMVSCKNGGCLQSKGEFTANTFGVMGAAQVCIMAEQDTIDQDNALFTGLGNVASIMLHSSGAMAVLRDIEIGSAMNSSMMPTVSMTASQASTMRNVSITAKKMKQIKLNANSQAVVEDIMIEPGIAVTDLVVNSKMARFADSVINGTRASNLSVSCSSNSTAMNCNNLTIHVPSSATKPSVMCSDRGCSNLVFYTQNGFDDLDLKVANCPCDIAVKTSCIHGELDIYCSASQGHPSVFVNNTCTGECCGDIVNDLRVPECYNGGGSSKKKSKAGAIVGGICGAIFAVILIVGIVYYFRKQKRMKDDPLIVNDESQ